MEYTITFDPKGKDYKTVAMAGNFNGWTPGNTTFEQDGDVWKSTVNLNPGAYQYQYVLDGTWVLDPNNPASIDNNVGGFNSVLKIGQTDVSGFPVLLTESHSGNTINISAENALEGWRVYWDNHRLDHWHVQIKKCFHQV